VTPGTSDAADTPPSRPRNLPKPSPPKASSPAGSLPPGSRPAVGWHAAVGPRVPDRKENRQHLPPLDEPEEPAAEPESADAPRADGEPPPPWETVRSNRPARRQPMLLQGALPAALALGLAGTAGLGTLYFAVAIFAVQVFLVLAVLALADAPASGGAFLVAGGAVLAADVVVVVDEGEIRGLAGVVALAVVASLLHQLVRPGRARVTESMADTLVAVTLGVSAACLLSLRALEGGDETVQVALLAAGASLLAGRIGDRLASRPMLAVGSTRGWPGLLLGLGAGVAAAVVVAGQEGVVVGTQAALLGLVCAATVAAADLAVDLGAAELRAGRRDARRVDALKPANLLLPFALLGPISLVAGHLVLG
jgi:hypothetical protein